MSPAENLLDISHLTRTVTKNGKPATIVDDFSFSFERGRIYTLLGPSGAGKSSLLRLVNRLDEASGGTILFHGKSTLDYSPCELRCKIGYLFQTPYLFEGTVRDNILYGCHKVSDEQVQALAASAHVAQEQIDESVENLSVGEKQRVALARLLATSPEIILLDEPTSALDPTHAQAIEDLIAEIVARQGITALMVTHHPEQALRMGGETLLLVKGKLVESGPSEDIVRNPRTELGRLYKEKKLK